MPDLDNAKTIAAAEEAARRAVAAQGHGLLSPFYDYHGTSRIAICRYCSRSVLFDLADPGTSLRGSALHARCVNEP
jgi:hypothetical protein